MTPVNDGKIFAHDFAGGLTASMKKLSARKDISEKNKKILREYLQDCATGHAATKGSKRKLSDATQLKNLFGLLVAAKHIEFDEIEPNNPKDRQLMKFIEMLERDQIVKEQTHRKKSPFNPRTKRDIKAAIRRFLKWRFGDNQTFPKCCEFFDMTMPNKEIRAISKDQAQAWSDAERNPRARALVMFLFDSGLRAEELINVRMRDITFDEEQKCYKVRVVVSKTKPRTIFLALSTDKIRNYLATYEDAGKMDAQLFPLTYDYLRKFISVHSYQHLKQRITPHGLRHASATYYCTLLNPYQLSYRYGWSMASAMPARYIDVLGLVDKQTPQEVKRVTNNALEEENRKLKEEILLLRTDAKNFKDSVPDMIRELMRENLTDLQKEKDRRRKNERNT